MSRGLLQMLVLHKEVIRKQLVVSNYVGLFLLVPRGK